MDRPTIIYRGIAGIVAFGLGAMTALLFATKRHPESDPDQRRQTTGRNAALPELRPLRQERSDAEEPQSYKGMPRFCQKVSVEHFFAFRSGFSRLFDTSSFNLAGEISEHFGLVPRETQLVSAELRQLYYDLRIIESKHARIAPNKKGEECIVITPSPEARSRTDAFVERLTENFADPQKGSELAQLIITNPMLAGGNFTQQLSIEQRTSSDGNKTDQLKRALYDETGALVDVIWIGLKGSPSVERAYEPIFSAASRQQD